MSPPERAEAPAANRGHDTANDDSPQPYIPEGTRQENEAFGRLIQAFPGSTIGEFEPNGNRSIDDLILDEPEPDVLVPLDFERLLADGVPEPDYLEPPYIVRGTRIWVFGPTESSKSVKLQHTAAKLTRQGYTVAYLSGENPLQTDLDRVFRLRPYYPRFRYYHMPAIDLAVRDDFLKVAEACGGADLVVFDTLSALWSGDENSNRDVVAFDRDVCVPLVRLTGAAVVVIHHTGHPQAFVSRGGASAGRGGSAMGQKADVVLVFQAVGPHEFTIEHAKNRTPGGHKEAKARFRVIDTEDGGLEIEELGKHIDERVAEAMDAAVEIVAGSDGTLGTNALKAALNVEKFGGSTVAPALRELIAEDPPRIRQTDGLVVGADGKRRKGRPWVTA